MNVELEGRSDVAQGGEPQGANKGKCVCVDARDDSIQGRLVVWNAQVDRFRTDSYFVSMGTYGM